MAVYDVYNGTVMLEIPPPTPVWKVLLILFGIGAGVSMVVFSR